MSKWTIACAVIGILGISAAFGQNQPPNHRTKDVSTKGAPVVTPEKKEWFENVIDDILSGRSISNGLDELSGNAATPAKKP